MYPKDAGYVLLVGMDDVRVADRTDFELFVSHVEDLGDGDRGLGVALCRNVVEKQLEIADDDKLSQPAPLNAARFRHFDVAFVGRSDSPRRVDSQWPFSCNSII